MVNWLRFQYARRTILKHINKIFEVITFWAYYLNVLFILQLLHFGFCIVSVKLRYLMANLFCFTPVALKIWKFCWQFSIWAHYSFIIPRVFPVSFFLKVRSKRHGYFCFWDCLIYLIIVNSFIAFLSLLFEMKLSNLTNRWFNFT